MAIFIMFCIACVAARFLAWFSFLVRIYNQCALLGLEGERKTKNYFEKDNQEGAKQSKVEELGSSQSSCTRWRESVGQKGWWPYVLTGSIRHEEKRRKRGLHSTHWYFWNTTSGQSGMSFVLPAAKWSSKNSHGVECRLFFPLLPPSACPTLPLSFSGVTTVLPSHGCISYLTNHKETHQNYSK